MPTHQDVQREVNLIRFPEPSKASDDALRAYRNHLLAARMEIRRASKRLAAGDLEVFLHCTDRRTLRQLKRVRQLILNLGVELGDHLKKFLLVEPEPEFEEEQ